MNFKLQSWKKVAILLCVFDISAIVLSYFLALWLRFDCSFLDIPTEYLYTARHYIIWYALIAIVIYAFSGLYNRIWRFAGYRELQHCVLAGLICILGHYICGRLMRIYIPLSYYVFGGFFQMGFLVFSRFIWRFLILFYGRLSSTKTGTSEKAMLIGAGDAGQLILRDLTTTQRRNISIKCIIDDDTSKWGCSIEDVPIVGGKESIPEAVLKYGITKIFVAMPAATVAQRKEILEYCQNTGCPVRVLPGLYQFTDGEVSLAKMRDVTVEDILGQENVSVNDEEIGASLQGKTVLVTGGGGAIGAELCRQIASCNPRKLIIYDVSENNIEEIQRRLQAQYPEVALLALVGSVRDSWRLEQIFQEYRPQVVFHAASYKRVALMEESPAEAIKNNVLGTYKTAYFAIGYGCERFVLISSDKGVNPTSFLGACTRLCEMLMQTMEHYSRTNQLSKLVVPTKHHEIYVRALTEGKTEFTAIRFGNTLDSNGSFFQRFQHQVADGGPVTFADRKMSRFCMGLENTVKLLLQASCMARDGEVFVLDMGTPVKLDDIARKLIKFSGMVPDEDIVIEYTGLMPGEKLEEEPLMLEEGMRKTNNSRIYIANQIQINYDEFLKNLHDFVKELDQTGKCSDYQKRMEEIVNSYHGVQHQESRETNVNSDTPANTVKNLEQIVENFDIPGDVQAALPVTKGYINHTYYVDTRLDDGTMKRYLLQRINTKVFLKPDELMENIANVVEHLKDFRLKGRPEESAVAQVIKTKNGQNYLKASSGAWRLVTCYQNVHSYDIPESPEVFRSSGEAFGSFLKAMSDYPAEKLHDVIPNFHNTWSRYQDLLKAIEKDPVGRAAQVRPEIEFIKKHEWLFSMIVEALQKGEIPLRVGHNDCNLNNVLFDNETNLPVAVVDLDTTMPSTPLYDFGDSIRIGTNTAKDDEKDLSKVSCDLNLFREYAAGWLSACGDMLTAKERELLPYAALVITSEDGIRFLMDHINGDTYYYIYYTGQNLDRARTQFALLADMEKKLPEIKRILLSIFAELK